MLVLNWNVIWVIVNIILLVVLLRIFLWKPVLSVLEKRRATIQNDLDDAARKNAKAEALAGQYELSLLEARQQSALLVGEAKERAQEQYDKIVAEAETEAQAIVQRANEEAEANREQILRESQSELAELVLAATAKLLGSSADSQANRKLLDGFLGGQS